MMPIAEDIRDHPILIGTTVVIIGFRECTPYIEGRAIIKGVEERRHYYNVKFFGDPRIQKRFVHPAYQDHPDDVVSWLIELWNTSLQSEHFDDFFPNNIS